MIPGDIGAEIARLLRAGAAAREWPPAAADLSAAGTWRPAPAAISARAGSYATSLPLELARLTRTSATSVAETLASGLAVLPWVSAVRPTGDGYLTITVTAEHLAALAPRIVAAGPAAASSDALAGRRLSAPAPADLGASATWPQAWQETRDALTGRLAHAAGAEVLFLHSQQGHRRPSPPQAGPVSTPDKSTGPGQVSDAVAYHGADAVRYALARASARRAAAIIRQLDLPLDLGNPFVAVRYAHADASSTLRWSADLGLLAGQPPDAGVAAPERLLAPELALLETISWLPERVAAAARRTRPAELAAFLEYLAGMWLDCRERCPALPFQGGTAPDPAATGRVTARLGLADAARTALSCGLGLLGIDAPERM